MALDCTVDKDAAVAEIGRSYDRVLSDLAALKSTNGRLGKLADPRDDTSYFKAVTGFTDLVLSKTTATAQIESLARQCDLATKAKIQRVAGASVRAADRLAFDLLFFRLSEPGGPAARPTSSPGNYPRPAAIGTPKSASSPAKTAQAFPAGAAPVPEMAYNYTPQAASNVLPFPQSPPAEIVASITQPSIEQQAYKVPYTIDLKPAEPSGSKTAVKKHPTHAARHVAAAMPARGSTDKRQAAREAKDAVGAELKKLIQGHVVFNNPSQMQVDEPYTIQAVLSKTMSVDELKKTLFEKANVDSSDLSLGQRMRVSLNGGSAFDVSPPGPQSQWVKQSGPTTWTWSVTPKLEGKHSLILAFDAVLKIEGTDDISNVTTLTRVIEVAVGWPKTFSEWVEYLKKKIEELKFLWVSLLVPLGGWIFARWHHNAVAPKKEPEPTGE